MAYAWRVEVAHGHLLARRHLARSFACRPEPAHGWLQVGARPEARRCAPEAGRSATAQPFTAPASPPRTRCFCSTKNMTPIGIMVNNEAPSFRGNWLPEDRPPFTRLARPVVRV